MIKKTKDLTKQPFFILTGVVCIVLLFVVIFVLFRISKRNNLRRFLKNDVEIELGTNLSIDHFLNESVDKAYIDTNLNTLDSVGVYKVKIKVQGETFYSNLKVIDTKNPYLEVRNLTIYSNEDLPEAQDFIVSINELSDYMIEPVEIVNQEGDQEVMVRVRDISGNFTEQRAVLTILSSEEGVVFQGITPIEIEIGQDVDILAGVRAMTRNMEEVSFFVDDSNVNYSQNGTYEIYYAAEDSFGNKTSVKRPVTIKKKGRIYQIKNFSTVNDDTTLDSSLLSFYRLLHFYHLDISMDTLITGIKKGSSLFLDHHRLYGGDPEVEYVGNPKDSSGYGVYQKPLVEFAQSFDLDVLDYTGHSLDEVLQQVKSGIPVQTWVTKDLETPISNYSWYVFDRRIDWYENMQSVVIVGYSSENVYVSVPNSSEIKEYQRNRFEEVFDILGKRSIFLKK